MKDLMTRISTTETPPDDKAVGKWFCEHAQRWPEGYSHPWAKSLALDRELENIELRLAATNDDTGLARALQQLVQVVREMNRP